MTFEETYQTYYQELYRFGYQLTQSDSDSKDLVHNVFLKYHAVTVNKTVVLNPRAWLYKVLYNSYLTQTVSSQNHKNIESIVDRSLPKSYDPNEEYNNEEMKNIILNVMYTMKRKDRDLLLMYYNGLKYAEIAEILEMNPTSIGKTISRTIEKFVKTFKQEYHEMF